MWTYSHRLCYPMCNSLLHIFVGLAFTLFILVSVDAVRRLEPLGDTAHIFSRCVGSPSSGAIGDAGDVGCCYHVGQLVDRQVRIRRFGGERIQSGSSQPALEQRFLVDQCAPGNVNQAGGGLHQFEAPSINDMACLAGYVKMQGEKISFGNHLI